MTHRNRTSMLAAVAALLAWVAPAWAQTERREFSVAVDGKQAGQSVVTIVEQADGSIAVTGSVNVQIKQVLFSYTYTYEGTEVWKGGKLHSLRSRSNDNGKRFEVQANAEPRGLRVASNGRERVVRAESWTTSYWKLADGKFHNQPVPILDVDTGKEINGRLQFVGEGEQQVAGQAIKCYHFRMTGAQSPVELWFDAQHRLVRQESTEDGHRTVVHLTGVHR